MSLEEAFLPHTPRHKEINIPIGTTFNRWKTISNLVFTASRYRSKRGKIVPINEWHVHIQCQCPKKTIAFKPLADLKHIKSCGCWEKDRPKGTHNKCKDPLYYTWINMKRRGNVCESWIDNFQYFYDWAVNNGYKKGLQLAKKDYNGAYSPDNCLFTSHQYTCNNHKRNRRIGLIIDGKYIEKTASEWSRVDGCSVSPDVICIRIDRGYDPYLAVFEESLIKIKITAWGENKFLTDWFKDSRNKCPNLGTLSARIRAGFLPEKAMLIPLNRMELQLERQLMKWKRLSLLLG